MFKHGDMYRARARYILCWSGLCTVRNFYMTVLVM